MLLIGGVFDGTTCAVVFLLAGGKKENIFFCNPKHSETDDSIRNILESENYSGLIVADLSVSEKFAEEINRKTGYNVTLFDHHKSAIPLLQYDWCHIEEKNTKCGCKILYEYMMQHCEFSQRLELQQLKSLVDVADDYDRWVRQLSDTENVSLFHDSLGQDLFVERFIKNQDIELDVKEQYLVDIERYKRDKYIEQKKKEAFYISQEINENVFNVAVVEANKYQSILGNELCSDFKNAADIAVLINSKSISLRAKQDCLADLSKIAQLNGGGGHLSAAGIPLNELLNEDFLRFVYSKIKWS